MQKSKLGNTLSLAKRAGKLIVGFDVVVEACIKKQALIVIVAQDVSPKTQKEITFVTQNNNVKQLQIPINMDEIWFHISKRAGIIAIIDKGFAEKIEAINNTIMEGNK